MEGKIFLKDCLFDCNLGVGDEERSEKQCVFIDIEIICEFGSSTKTDSIGDTINYSEVHKIVKELVEGMEYKLIERMANDVGELIVDRFNVLEVLIRVRKPDVMKRKNVGEVGVEIKFT